MGSFGYKINNYEAGSVYEVMCGVRKKYDTKPVEVSLLSATHKVSNMIFSLNFYQKDAVGGNRHMMTSWHV